MTLDPWCSAAFGMWWSLMIRHGHDKCGRFAWSWMILDHWWSLMILILWGTAKTHDELVITKPPMLISRTSDAQTASEPTSVGWRLSRNGSDYDGRDRDCDAALNTMTYHRSRSSWRKFEPELQWLWWARSGLRSFDKYVEHDVFGMRPTRMLMNAKR